MAHKIRDPKDRDYKLTTCAQNNRRVKAIQLYDGTVLSMADLAKIAKCPVKTINSRVNHNFPYAELINCPNPYLDQSNEKHGGDYSEKAKDLAISVLCQLAMQNLSKIPTRAQLMAGGAV